MRALLEVLESKPGGREYVRDAGGKFAAVPKWRVVGDKQKAFNDDLVAKANDIDAKLSGMKPGPDRDKLEREARVLRAARQWAPPIVMNGKDGFAFRLDASGADNPVYGEAMKLWKDWGDKLGIGVKTAKP